MTKFNWKQVLAWLLAAFFVVGGLMNIFASPDIVADYESWGYPGWFHYVTGALELTAAALLILPGTRLAGGILASFVMAAAAGTVLANGEFSHALAPLAVLSVAAVVSYLAWIEVKRAV